MSGPRHRRPLTPMGRAEEAARVAQVHELAAADLTAAGYEVQVASDEPDASSLMPAPPPAGPPAHAGRTMDWQSSHDERSRAYALADRLRHRVALQDHLWAVGPVLDQGREGACVGFACADAANSLELSGLLPMGADAELADAADALHLYGRAQELDDISGEDYVGTSVLAGMKAGQEAGWWEGYGWCFGTRDLAQAVLQVGPVVVGIPWTAGMYATEPNGRVQVTGATVGGHCVAVVGLRMALPGVFQTSPPGPYFVIQNSWGAGYGDAGLGYVHHADMARLLADAGEAAIPLAAGWEPTP